MGKDISGIEERRLSSDYLEQFDTIIDAFPFMISQVLVGIERERTPQEVAVNLGITTDDLQADLRRAGRLDLWETLNEARH